MTHIDKANTIDDASGISYQVLTTLRDIEAISAEWDLVLDQSCCNRAFSCSKWFLASATIDHHVSPYVIVARRGSQIAGILPLSIANDGQTLTFAGEMSDYNDMIANDSDRDVLAGLLSSALRFGKRYRRIVLNRVRPDCHEPTGAENDFRPALGFPTAGLDIPLRRPWKRIVRFHRWWRTLDRTERRQ